MTIPEAIRKAEADPLGKRFFTKSIETPSHLYETYKLLPFGLMSAIKSSQLDIEKGDKPHTNLGYAAAILERQDFPTYYVSEQIINAVKHTHPPESIKWSDMKLPFDGMMFMLPRGAVMDKSPNGEQKSVFMLGYAKILAQQQVYIPSLEIRTSGTQDEKIIIFWAMLYRDEDGHDDLCFQDSTYPTTQTLEPSLTFLENAAMNLRTMFIEEHTAPSSESAVYISAIVANLILLMEARANLIEPSKLVRKRKIKSDRPNIWSAAFIGRNYKVATQKTKTEAEACFTELIWRAGHYRRQHFGPKGEQVKTIWIEPYIALGKGLVALEKNA